MPRFFNPVSRRKGYEYSPGECDKGGSGGGGERGRSRARKGDVGGCRRRQDGSLFLSAVNNLSLSSSSPPHPPFHLPAIFLADLASSARARALDAARKFTGRTFRCPDVSQILLFTILPDARRAPRAAIVAAFPPPCIGKFTCAHGDFSFSRID